MPSVSYPATITYVIDGEAVRAQTPNRPLLQLGQRTQYLYESLREAALGELIIARNVVIEAGLDVGTPLYLDAATGTWRPALAALNLTQNDYGYPAASAELRGVVLLKHTETTADVGLFGRVSASRWSVDWTDVIDTGVFTSGTYYLSSATSGKITKTRSVLSVYFGNITADGTLYFNPGINGNLRGHLHQRFHLNDTMVADLNTEGWAPVAVFGGAGYTVPTGAQYGYVFRQNAELAAYFPMVPPQFAYLSFKGRGLTDSLDAVIDENGIWWMNTNYTPATIDTADGYNVSDAFWTYDQPFELWLTRVDFGVSIVTSLTPTADTEKLPVEILNSSGVPATSGALTLGLANSVIADGDDDAGILAIKTINGVKAKRGPVVSRIIPGSNVVVEAAAGDATNGFYGPMVIHAGSNGEVIGDPTTVSLDNVREDPYKHLHVLNMPKSRVSRIRFKIQVPTNILSASKLRLVMDIVGNQSTPSGPELACAYTLVRAGVAIPDADTSLPAVTYALTLNQITRVQTTAVDVNPGDDVFIEVARQTAAATDVLIMRTAFRISRT